MLQHNVVEFLQKLIQTLFENDYFGFEQSAQDYVSKLYDFIEFELVKASPRSTPQNLTRFGSWYVFYKANNRTTWYIFFESLGSKYLITHITNNHCEEAGFL